MEEDINGDRKRGKYRDVKRRARGGEDMKKRPMKGGWIDQSNPLGCLCFDPITSIFLVFYY